MIVTKRPPPLTRAEILALGALLAVWAAFTWPGITRFYSGDDMTNMYRPWDMSAWRLLQAQFLLWMPVYRPVGDGVYRLFYACFGFHPLPLYLFCWLLLAANVIVGYIFSRRLLPVAPALTAVALVLVHGSFIDLYSSAGMIYDRLCYFFTILALIAYMRWREAARPRWLILTFLFSILAMGSKESGAAVVGLIVCCELLFRTRGADTRACSAGTFPGSRGLKPAPHRRLPAVLCLGLLVVVFVVARIPRTPGLLANPGYRPDVNVSTWLAHLGAYLGILTYRHLVFSPTVTLVVLIGMGVVAAVLRSRPMLFGWMFFQIAITPVALIVLRDGYVLYLPGFGLGLFFAAMISHLVSPFRTRLPRIDAIAFGLVTILVTFTHVRNWPRWPPPSPEARLTDQFRREFPNLPPHSRLLFVTDEFPRAAWDLPFNLRLLYHDKSLVAHRLQGSPEQQPLADAAPSYDHIFAFDSGRYEELDRRDPAESIRLNILSKYPVAGEMEIARPDYFAYVVFGLKHGDRTQPSRWTEPHARLKFKPGASASAFSAQFWIPEVVTRPPVRTLSVAVNGSAVGSRPLTREGMNQIRFPIPSGLIRADSYTVVDITVDNPYTDANNIQYGVVLLRAGFD